LIRRLISIGCVACLFCAFPITLLSQSDRPVASSTATDFVDFWAAARLLLDGRNPFSPAEVLELQQSVGMSEAKPLLMWNPPWTLSIILPFGALDYHASQFAWMLLHVFSILVAAQKLWVVYGNSEKKSYLPWIIALTFVPAWFVLIIGQISPLVLLGIVGFLYFEKKQKSFFAGASLVLVSIKPHLVYLFWIGLIVWIWKKRRWHIVLGAFTAGVIATAIPLIIDPLVYVQFIDMYRFPGRSTPFELPAPSLGSLLTLYVPHGKFPIQFLPPLAGTLWFLSYWQHYKESWNWPEQIPLMILVSMTFGFYAWTYDYVLMLPAVFDGFDRVRSANSQWHRSSPVLFYGCTNVVYLIAKLFITTDLYYFWLAPAFLFAYTVLVARAATKVLPA
jgi:hypothetical protein